MLEMRLLWDVGFVPVTGGVGHEVGHAVGRAGHAVDHAAPGYPGAA